MLNLDWNIIWNFVNIIILYFLLKKFLFKPINKIMDERAESIQEDIDSAKKLKTEAEEIKKSYNDALSAAKDEAKQIISESHEQAEFERKLTVQEAKDEAKKIIDDANRTIENQTKKAINDVQSQIADLVMSAASKIVSENIDDDMNRKIVDDFLSEEAAD